MVSPPMLSGAMTSEERWSQAGRTISEGRSRMAGGTLYTLMAGAGAVSFLGAMEGWLCIKPKSKQLSTAPRLTILQKCLFVGRYSLAQIVPSMIQESQPVNVIAKLLRLPPEHFFSSPCSAPPGRHLMINRVRAIRGALAGSVVLSQVIATVEVLAQTRTQYVDRIRNGREPPLQDPHRHGVVIRLTGQASLMSNLTMAREGRRHFFPIVENPKHPDTVSLVNDHAPAVEPGHNPNKKVRPRVPVFWHVRDGGYSHKASWRGMFVPQSWLFSLPTSEKDKDDDNQQQPKGLLRKKTANKIKQRKPARKLLILEGDATPGDNTAMSLHRPGVEEFDLDLYEVAQGFTQVQNLVVNNNHDEDKKKTKNHHKAAILKTKLVWKEEPIVEVEEQEGELKTRQSSSLKRRHRPKEPWFETMRILLVDPEATYTSGGGRQMTVRAHATELGLADVIVDSRNPLIYSMTNWLEQFSDNQKTKWRFRNGNKQKPVVLETPQRDWFESIQAELDDHGYKVMDRSDALAQYGSLEGIPFLVYERNTADTLNTVRQLIDRQMTSPTQLCALCPRPWMLEAIMQSLVDGVTYISSSDIHDRLLRWVRCEALAGKSAKEIQEELDTNMHDILHEAMTDPKYANGQYVDTTTTTTTKRRRIEAA